MTNWHSSLGDDWGNKRWVAGGFYYNIIIITEELTKGPVSSLINGLCVHPYLYIWWLSIYLISIHPIQLLGHIEIIISAVGNIRELRYDYFVRWEKFATIIID